MGQTAAAITRWLAGNDEDKFVICSAMALVSEPALARSALTICNLTYRPRQVHVSALFLNWQDSERFQSQRPKPKNRQVFQSLLRRSCSREPLSPPRKPAVVSDSHKTCRIRRSVGH